MEPIRLVAVVSVVLLTWCSLLVLAAFRDQVPRPVYVVGLTQGAALAVAAVGVVVNAFSSVDVSPGVYVASTGFTACFLVVAAVTFRVVRRPRLSS